MRQQSDAGAIPIGLTGHLKIGLRTVTCFCALFICITMLAVRKLFG